MSVGVRGVFGALVSDPTRPIGGYVGAQGLLKIILYFLHARTLARGNKYYVTPTKK